MTTLTLVITDAGRQALIDEDNMGTLPVLLTEIGVGTGKWEPAPDALALQNELKRISAVGGLAVADDIMHLTLTDSSTDAYSLGEFGIYTDTGVLFAIYSDLDGIADKAADGLLLIAADVILTSITPGSVAVGDTGFHNPPATETVPGVAELATQAEATAGTDDARIMTPLKAKGAAAAYQYTADQALPTPANTGTLAQLFSWLAGLIKGITGKADWKTAPATTLEAAAAHHGNSANPHATTAAQVGAEPAFSAGTASQYRRGDKTWQDLATAVRAVVLTGLSTATNAVITAADSILSAMGKLQAQITAHNAASAPHAGHETPAGAQTKVDAHGALTAPHSATSAATANRLMLRDASGRAKVAAPSASDDIARKDTVDAVANDGEYRSIRVFSASGTWIKPAGLKRARVTVVGGGGGGGGSSLTNYRCGGGGGGGGQAIKTIEAASLGSTEAVSIGAGGAAGTSNASGGGGGTSSFGAHCSATGGAGGPVGSSGGSAAGGSGIGGNINIIGGSGQGVQNSNVVATSHPGGSSYGNGGKAASMEGPGQPGQHGSGGSGGWRGGTSQNGGAGGVGLVIVEEYF